MSLVGAFDDRLEPIVELEVGPSGTGLSTVPFLLDTGFNLEVAVTQSTFDVLGLEKFGVRRYTASNGEQVDAKTALVSVRFKGDVKIDVFEAIVAGYDVIGTQFLNGALVTLDVRSGGEVTVVRSD